MISQSTGYSFHFSEQLHNMGHQDDNFMCIVSSANGSNVQDLQV